MIGKLLGLISLRSELNRGAIESEVVWRLSNVSLWLLGTWVDDSQGYVAILRKLLEFLKLLGFLNFELDNTCSSYTGLLC